MTEYQEKYKQLQDGLISQEEWERYCIRLLFEILEKPETIEIFKRLKLWTD